MSSDPLVVTEPAGERTEAVLTQAPGNAAAIGGIVVRTASGWFAARPSGNEPLTRIHAASFRGADHLQALLQEAQVLVDAVSGPA